MDDMTKRVVSPAIQKIMAEGTKHKYSDRTMSNSIPQFSIGLEMDYPCVQHCGGTDSDAFKYGLTVIAAISDIYLRDAGMTFVCSEHLEWTTPDTYQSDSIGDPLLNEFDGSNLTGGAPSLFMLLSGRQMHWAVGIAKGVGILCQGGQSACVCGMTNSLKKNGWDYPYHSMIRDVMVCSHETGHLVACFHTQDCSWNPALDSCVTCENYGSPTPGYCYDTPVPTRGTIMSYCQSYILKFHPRCVDAIQQMIPSYSCFTNVSVPQLTILPSKQIQECAGGQYHFTCSASNGTGPYLFEVNPPPDSLIASGNNCTIVLNPAKAQKFYVRLADGESVRVYDSITFSPLASFVVNVSMDSVISGPDSMVLTAHMPGLSDSVAYVWFKLPNALGRSAGNSNTFTVSRKTASRYSIRIATSGGCVAFDTVLVTATPSLGAVTGARSGEPVGSSIYPNPATQWLSAILPSPSVQCWIEDVLGRRMDAIASVSPNGASSQRIDFDLSRLSSGTYWLVWDAAGKISVSSFVKQ